MLKQNIYILVLSMASVFFAYSGTSIAEDKTTPRINIEQNQEQGKISVTIDGRDAFVYCYGDNVDLPHLYPMRSPSGNLLTIEQAEPYPHHRSFWFADT